MDLLALRSLSDCSSFSMRASNSRTFDSSASIRSAAFMNWVDASGGAGIGGAGVGGSGFVGRRAAGVWAAGVWAAGRPRSSSLGSPAGSFAVTSADALAHLAALLVVGQLDFAAGCADGLGQALGRIDRLLVRPP